MKIGTVQRGDNLIEKVTPDKIREGDSIFMWGVPREVLRIAENDYHGTANAIYYEVEVGDTEQCYLIELQPREEVEVARKKVTYPVGTLAFHKHLQHTYARRQNPSSWINLTSLTDNLTTEDITAHVRAGRMEIVYAPPQEQAPAFVDDRCPYVCTDPLVTRGFRDDNWRCGKGVDKDGLHANSHVLYTADTGEVIYQGASWALPKEN